MPCSTPAFASRTPNGACATSPISKSWRRPWASHWSKPRTCRPTILCLRSGADSETLRDVIPPADLVPQECIAQRDEARAFAVVLAVAVTAGRRFVEPGVVSHRLQLGRHLAGVAGMHTVVAARGGDQDRRIILAQCCGVIGGIGFQPFPL